MNMSNCAMSKENTPIFSCVLTKTSKTSISDADFFDSDEIEFHTSLFDNDAKCEPHMNRLKEDNRTFIGSWRCPDFWQESADTLNNYCERPGIFKYWLDSEFVTLELNFEIYIIFQRRVPYSSDACRINVAHAKWERTLTRGCSNMCSQRQFACS